jgi:hypothetical protein
MSIIRGDEAAILIEFLNQRLRGNTAGWKVQPMPTDPGATFPCIGYNFTSLEAPIDQGGEVLFAKFSVNVMCIGALGLNDIAPLRTIAREIADNLNICSADIASKFGHGTILSSTVAMPVSYSDRDAQGAIRWYHGAQWNIHVQPNAN